MMQWFYKLIGKKLSSKLGLKETTMAEEVTSKSWYKSKTVWAAIITAILGAVTPISTAFGHPIQIPEWVISVLVGMGLYYARTSTAEIK